MEFDAEPQYDEHEQHGWCQDHGWFNDSNLCCPECERDAESEDDSWFDE